MIEKFNFKPGRILAGKYKVVVRLGGGWEGEVYKVKEISTGITRALKLFFPHRNKRQSVSKAYAQKLHRLRDCPVVMPYHSYEVIDFLEHKVVVLISDFIEGEILTDYIKKQSRGKLNVFQGTHLLYALACGVADIHYFDEYHGDLHSGNIIVKRHGLGFDLKFIDLFLYKGTKRDKISNDICEIIAIFHEAIGGGKIYSKHPDTVKEICCGLKRTIINKKFRTAAALKNHLEHLSW